MIISNKEGDINKISFNPRWREELVAHSSEGTLIFELTMGSLHVYFPDENRWKGQAPSWAKDKWQIYKDACEAWCKLSKIPMTIAENTFMYEEK